MKANSIKDYEELIDFLEANKDKYGLLEVSSLIEEAEVRVFALDIINRYNLPINPKQIVSTDYSKLSDNIFIGFWDGVIRRIAWPIDDRQPENEYLISIQFPTGAYIFNKHYVNSVFDKFWEELLTYRPDYIDKQNHGLYWRLDNANAVLKSYEKIFQEYKKEADIVALKNQISSLQLELQNKTT